MRKLTDITLISLISAILYFPFLGNVHLFDWDEINFAEIAREMNETGKYINAQIDFQNFTEKPPLFMWLQAISMKIFGVNEFAARFPNAFLGVLVSIVLYLIGSNTISSVFGWIWTLMWWSSILPHLYFKSGIIDPWFNFFIFTAFYLIIKHYHRYKKGNKKLTLLIYSGIFCGLALLTKGPVALLILTLVFLVYWIFEKFRWFLPFWQYLVFLFVSLFTFSIWLLVDYFVNGPDFIIEFTIRQWELLTKPDAGHKGFFGYHFVILFFGCVPSSSFLIAYLFDKAVSERNLFVKDLIKWMLILLSVVVVLFSLVKTKIVHYSSLAYYPITFVGAYYAYKILSKQLPVNKILKISFFTQFIALMIASFLVPFIFSNKQFITDKIKDPFAVENLEASLVIWRFLDYFPLLLSIACFAILISWRNKFNRLKLLLLTVINILWIQSFLYLHTGNIERISQGANIRFFKSLKNLDVYPITFNYRSYANLFYSEKRPASHPNAGNMEWLLYGDIDKPVYISVRTYHLNEFKEKVNDAKFIYSENGFYFFKREIPNAGLSK
ncbi:ArnT family glycosyltransferase [Schleiferia thermophila]|uniref:4-amino-4-deoxy-L-arabinose transferase-like glycosyltransferase n=1 Tax=Schleiferia thermophila TaxID=884107 RepID=A0A368ZVV5_9FLAO|nr:glycosyltransferase family 39 protein [Schleiferia thermophila]RCX01083.1 4-amino-4-deoxy-L-arabinose transferase-like glycosyltransferase [Schleiferia thermophila]GCD80881.1 hypothetical protein JCM30197_21280 [Schleiferia thermophila]